jgi:hypothetical protein
MVGAQNVIPDVRQVDSAPLAYQTCHQNTGADLDFGKNFLFHRDGW